MSINLLTHVVSTLFLNFWPLVPCFCGSQKKKTFTVFGLFLVTTLLKVFWIHKSKNLKLVSTCIEISVPLPTLLTCNLTLIPFQVMDQWITNFWFRHWYTLFKKWRTAWKKKKTFSFLGGEFIWIKSWVFKRSVFENFKLHFVQTSLTSFSSHCRKCQITCVISMWLEKEQMGPRIVFHFINTISTNPWKDTINKFCLLIREKISSEISQLGSYLQVAWRSSE